MKATLQDVATLSTTIVPLANAMLHKTKTMRLGEKVLQMVLPTGTKIRNVLMDFNEVAKKQDLVPFLCSSSVPSTIHILHFEEAWGQIC